MTLTEFLLARIAEDEAGARIAVTTPGPYDWGTESCWHEMVELAKDEGAATSALDLVCAFAPARVIAECEAKRQIVEAHSEEGQLCRTCGDNWHDWPEKVVRVDYPCPTLRFLALPYSDHPDYREEWRP